MWVLIHQSIGIYGVICNETGLIIATTENHPRCVEILIENGADTAIVDKEGRSVQTIAISFRYKRLKHCRRPAHRCTQYLSLRGRHFLHLEDFYQFLHLKSGYKMDFRKQQYQIQNKHILGFTLYLCLPKTPISPDSRHPNSQSRDVLEYISFYF